MKISFVLVCTCAIFSIKKAHGSAIGDPFYPLNPEDLTEGDTKEIEILDSYYHRPKRTLGPLDPISGSAGLLSHLKSAAIAGAKHKIGTIISGSAGAVTGTVSAASSGAKAVAGAVNHLKLALLTEAAKKVVGVSTGVATGASKAAINTVSGASGAVKSLKTAALTGISQKIGQIAIESAKAAAGASAGIAKGSVAAIAGTSSAVKYAKNEVLLKVGKTVGAIASGSAKAVIGASAASSSTVNNIKTAAVKGIVSKIGSASTGAAVGLATAGSTVLGLSAKGVKGAISGSANFIFQLKSALITGISKAIGLVASGSVKVATGASSGLTTKIGQASGNIAAGSADAVVQLKHAAIAGTKQKLGQVASGLAGAVTGAVGSASAGAGQLARDAFFGSAHSANSLKKAAILETKNKIGQVAGASAGLVASGSAVLANGVKSVVVGSASAIAKKIGYVSAGIGQVGIEAAKGSLDTANHIKSAAVTGLSTKIGKVIAGLSAGAVAATSGHVAKTSAIGPKRSESAWSSGSGAGSADIVTQLKSAVLAGLTKKIGQVAKGSAGAVAGASAGFSKGSFGGDAKGYNHDTYGPSEHGYDHKPTLNVWELKKSVLNTLLQAVKAIKGGVLAIKGQLIKGSGYVVAGSGQLIAAGGDKVSSLGKNIISNAVLIHPHKEHHIHSEYGHPSASYTAPSGPPVVYDSPPSSGSSYESHYESPYDHHNDKPQHAAHAGLLVLKKIPSNKDTYHTSHSNPEESRVPAFKPLTPTGPGIGTLFGKFFTASTSLDPTQPTSFGDADHGEAYSSHGGSHYAVDESHDTSHPPAPLYYEEPRTKLEAAAPPNFQVPLAHDHSSHTSSSGDFVGNSPPLSHSLTNYAPPFDESHNFLNINDHLGAEASNTEEHKIKLTKGEILDHLETSPTLASSQIKLPKDAPQSFDAVKNSLKASMIKKPSSSEFLTNGASGEILFKPSSTNYLGGPTLYQRGEKLSSGDISFDPSIKLGATYSRFKTTPSKSSFSQNLVPTNDHSLDNFLPQQEPETFSASKGAFDGLSSAEHYHKYLEHFPFHKVAPRHSSSSRTRSSKYKSPQKLRMQNDYRQRRPSTKGGYSVVKSLSYELTPEGAKRLT